MINRQSHMSG